MSTHPLASTSLQQAPALPRIQAWGPVKRALVILAGWTAYTVFFISQYAVSEQFLGKPLDWPHLIFAWGLCGAVWAMVTPGILFLSERFPIRREALIGHLGIHLAGALAAWFAHASTYSVLARALDMAPKTGHLPVWVTFRNVGISEIHADVLIYALIVGAHHGFQFYNQYRERELRTSQLETRLAEAQLQALKMQLHPHFLFNTLNTISVLMLDDTASANRMLIRLSSLLRVALDGAGVQQVPLAKELEFLRAYLDIEQTRFEDRLTVHFDVAPETECASVPNLLLQPLVENAIHHGVSRRAGAGRIDVTARRAGPSLEITVQDDGPGLSVKAAPDGHGVGLANTKARLVQLYGSKQRFEIANAPNGGVRVSVLIPFEPASASV